MPSALMLIAFYGLRRGKGSRKRAAPVTPSRQAAGPPPDLKAARQAAAAAARPIAPHQPPRRRPRNF